MASTGNTPPQARILAEATDIYLAEGIEGLSMRKIGARLGVSATAIYRHFENKEQLVGEILLGGVRTFAQYIYAALRGLTPEERLRMAAEAILRFAIEQPKHYEVFFLKKQPVAALSVREEFEQQRRATFRFLMDRVRECMDAGALRRGDVAEVALALLTQTHGLLSMQITSKLDMSDERFIRAYWSIFDLQLAGLAPSAAQPAGAGSTRSA